MVEILLVKAPGADSSQVIKDLTAQNIALQIAHDLDTARGALELGSFNVILLLQLGFGPEVSDFLSTISAKIPVLYLENHPFDPLTIHPFGEGRYMDYLILPVNRDELLFKTRLLNQVHILEQDLLAAQENNLRLKEKINALHRSVDGHNSFLELMSRRDGLTGLYNRRHFNSIIRDLFEKTRAEQGQLALLIVNIDYFSEINKSCGQEFGDFVLNELSARLTSSSREQDLCFRMSGEEFAIIMPETSETEALEKAEELRTSCAQKSYDNGNCIRTITISVGIASMCNYGPLSHEELINSAYQALFTAKSEGRNRCILHIPSSGNLPEGGEQHFQVLQDTLARILQKTKVSTMRSLNLLAQAIMDESEKDQIHQAQQYIELMGQQLGFPDTLIDTFKNAIMLLSCIRYLMHYDVLNKQRGLTENEWRVLADFPQKLGQMTEMFDFFSGERTLLIHHGEKFDGTGYPDGLSGEEIPLGARIFSLACSLAAMNSKRPYRNRLTAEEIVTELAENAGKQFDPKLVLKLIDIIEEKSIFKVDGSLLEFSRRKISSTLIE